MDGHDLEPLVGLQVGQRVEIGEPVLERRPDRRSRPLPRATRDSRSRFRRPRGRSCPPRRPGRKAQTRRRRPARAASRGNARRDTPAARRAPARSRARPSAESAATRAVVVHQLPHRALRVAAGERVEVGERQPAPRRAQQREPGEPVGRMRERARQRQQVLHHRAVAELLDLDRAEAQAGVLQLRHDLAQVAAVAHQDGDDRFRVLAPRLRDDLGHSRRLPRAVAVEERMHADRRAGQHRARRDRRRVRHRAGGDVLALRHDPGEGRVHPLDDAGLRAEIGRQADRLRARRPAMPAARARRNSPTSASRKR